MKETMLLMAHIDVCDFCRDHLVTMQKTTSMLKDLPEVTLPAGFENRMHFAFKHEAAAKKKSRLYKATMIAMPVTVAVFAAIIGFNYVFSGGLLGAMKSTNQADGIMAMEMAEAPMVDATYAVQGDAMQKSEAEGDSESFGASLKENVVMDEAETLSEARDTEKAATFLSIRDEVVIFVMLTGDAYEEFQSMINELVEPLKMQQGVIIAQDGAYSVTTSISMEHYAVLIDLIAYAQFASLEEAHGVKNLVIDENNYFEVTFLFQQNNH